jgi:hypothetical protein
MNIKKTAASLLISGAAITGALSSVSPANAAGASYSVTGAAGLYAKVWGTYTLQTGGRSFSTSHGIRDLTTDGKLAEGWYQVEINGAWQPSVRFDASGVEGNVYRTYQSPTFPSMIQSIRFRACRTTYANCGTAQQIDTWTVV